MDDDVTISSLSTIFKYHNQPPLTIGAQNLHIQPAMTTDSSKGTHPTRQPSSSEQQLIDDILLLYQLQPSEKAYNHYAPNAVFHDPVSIAKGLDSIKSQFNGMPKLFASSVTEKCDILPSESGPGKLAMNLTQRYVFKSALPGKSEGGEKTVNSKVTLWFNGEGLIEKHDEEWDHEANKSGEDGFMGKMQQMRKKVDAKVVEKTVSSDPSKV
ncbi:MAG: hypothetical protein L6R40_007572 [Gallowayella cf. fulva]|nr:MAG: hypothetical protein L6R40_007572 [Xanthomendoza cf. fulva]